MRTGKTVFIITLPFLIMLIGCPSVSDCWHNFSYEGMVNVNDSLLKDSLVIRFDNLGDIIFNIQNRKLWDSSFVNSKGNFKVIGNFLAICKSDKNRFDDKDSLSFELVWKGKIIKSGKFCIKNLERQYTDSTYYTTIKLPVIKVE